MFVFVYLCERHCLPENLIKGPMQMYLISKSSILQHIIIIIQIEVKLVVHVTFLWIHNIRPHFAVDVTRQHLYSLENGSRHLDCVPLNSLRDSCALRHTNNQLL